MHQQQIGMTIMPTITMLSGAPEFIEGDLKETIRRRSSKVPGLSASHLISGSSRVNTSVRVMGVNIPVSIVERKVYGVVTRDGMEMWRGNGYRYLEADTAKIIGVSVQMPSSDVRMWQDSKRKAIDLAEKDANNALGVIERDILKKEGR